MQWVQVKADLGQGVTLWGAMGRGVETDLGQDVALWGAMGTSGGLIWDRMWHCGVQWVEV